MLKIVLNQKKLVFFSQKVNFFNDEIKFICYNVLIVINIADGSLSVTEHKEELKNGFKENLFKGQENL